MARSHPLLQPYKPTPEDPFDLVKAAHLLNRAGFGGTPAVCTTAMLFFQTLLLAGYAYAHLSVQYFKPAWQVAVHLALLAAAVMSLPFVPV